jgi:hypothetical protein
MSRIEVDVVLGLITKACMSVERNGICTREWVEKFSEDQRHEIGGKITYRRFPEILELLKRHNLITIKREASGNRDGNSMPRIYGLGQAHPLFNQWESIIAVSKS